MSNMTISDFYDRLLSDKEWQDPETGKLFFPSYIFTYDPAAEYQIRKEILNLKDRLIRPTSLVDTLILNIFDEFIEFLKFQKLGDQSYLELVLEQEQINERPEEFISFLKDQANKVEFFDFVHRRALEHFQLPSKYKKVYLMLYGFGSIFPFLRASTYLKNFEKYVAGYKLIVFFPGSYKNQYYHLFNEFNDENIYRAILVNQ